MKRLISITALFIFLTGIITAQIAPEKYYIQFTDKNNSPYSINNPEEYLAQRSIDRRTSFNIPVDVKDLPVNPQYLQGVKDAGASILNPTKWLNGVTVQTSDPSVITAIEALPYVANVTKAAIITIDHTEEKDFFANESFGLAEAVNTTNKGTTFFDYGPSLNQISMLKGDQMHEMGYRGEGVIIGVLDSGFDNADELEVFDSLWNNNQILATHDFVAGGPIAFDKHYHGSMVLSTMGGNYPGQLIGTAPKANYLLIRTEDAATEYISEEYNWVSGAEFADSIGADVLNTSLGYSEFDNPSQNHTYEDMDGNTTPITIGADVAASRGMVVVNSAGNSGTSSWYYITAPADGDSVFTIGAVNASGNFAAFSGHGPTYDGRVKPNVVAQGEGAYTAWIDGSFIYSNGTSFSSPITAGMMACLLQANTDMTNMDLMNAVQASGSIATAPDDEIGYGIPDFMAAHNILTVIESYENEPFSDLKLYPNPFTSSVELVLKSKSNSPATISIVDMTGRKVFENDYQLESGNNNIQINELETLPSGIYFMRMESAASAVTMKMVKQ